MRCSSRSSWPPNGEPRGVTAARVQGPRRCGSRWHAARVAGSGQGVPGVRNRLPLVLSVVLAVMRAGLSTPVAALGLGQIQVLSRSGEPLLAEIPIVSNDPRELEQLQARLASPDTFRRIGLEPPQGAAADLRFAV